MAIVPAGRLGSLQRLPRFTMRRHRYDCFAIGNLWLPSPEDDRTLVGDGSCRSMVKRIGHDRVVEIGAVTPYYWPGRITMVVDHYDPHPLVTHRTSLFGTDLSGLDVLAISTLEHIGVGDYGPVCGEETPVYALEKICRDSRRFLVSIPYGLNPAVDATLFSNHRFPDDVTALCMVRSEQGNDWRESPVRAAAIPLGACDRHHHSANSVLIVERGGLL